MPTMKCLTETTIGERPCFLRLMSLAIVLAFAANHAGAAVITVDVLTDGAGGPSDCELRSAIEAANTNTAIDGCVAGGSLVTDEIHFSVTGTIVLSAALASISSEMRIVGPGKSELTVDGDSQFRIFQVQGTNTFELSGMRLFQGTDTGSGGCVSSTSNGALFEDLLFESCDAGSLGGALFLQNIVTLRRVTVSQCASSGGGAFATSGSTITVEDSLFVGNEEQGGGAGGGGILVAGNGNLTVRRSTLSGNTSSSSGSAIAATFSNAVVTIEDSTLTQNTTSGGANGGAIFNNGTLTIGNSVVAENIDTLAGRGQLDLVNSAIGTVITNGHNFIGNNEGSSTEFPGGLPNAFGDYVGIPSGPFEPLLFALSANGGPTDSHEPAPGSPLVDKGSCTGVPVDQRGFHNRDTLLRIVDEDMIVDADDGCDIGSVEQGALEPSFFADGFESGDLTAWS